MGRSRRSFEASRTVEVRPRVAGALRSIHFRDGDMVRQGQLLFTIDPRPFEAALAKLAPARPTPRRGLRWREASWHVPSALLPTRR
jgi:multidrug resistance efflux pump